VATLLQLRTGAKVHANKQSTQFLTDGEWDGLINKAYRALWQDVVAIDPTFRTTSAAFTLTGSTNTSFLPSNFMEAIAVRRDPGTTNEIYLDLRGTRTRGLDLTYRIEGGNVIVDPKERAAGNYALDYGLAPTDMASDGSIIDAELDQFREYIELKAAIFALASEESSITELAALLGDEVARVKRWASRRRRYDPDVIEDVRPRWRAGRGRRGDFLP
jgi:hypothetical protein